MANLGPQKCQKHQIDYFESTISETIKCHRLLNPIVTVKYISELTPNRRALSRVAISSAYSHVMRWTAVNPGSWGPRSDLSCINTEIVWKTHQKWQRGDARWFLHGSTNKHSSFQLWLQEGANLGDEQPAPLWLLNEVRELFSDLRYHRSHE